jgi:anthranilate phosphoribosyltransferase
MASSSLSELTDQLKASLNLQPEQVELAAGALAAPEVTEDEKAAFLIALSGKGETATEVAAFAKAFRARAVDPGLGEWAAEAIDIVGTGGDHAGGFNISSLVVLTLASGGVKVMKHGNRGITSKCGSADLLAGLGVDLGATPEKLRRAVAELGYVYLLATNYHPAFKHIAPVRKALAVQGQRTIFNILGPLINPARPAHTVLGVFSAAWVPRMAGALETMGATAGLVVHGVIEADRGIDELTTATRNLVRGAGRMSAIDGEWHAGDFGIKPAPFAELQGGDVAANLAITEAILDGRGPRGLTDTIVLNTAVGLWICGRFPDVVSGLEPARELLLGGAVAAKIAATREFYTSS